MILRQAAAIAAACLIAAAAPVASFAQTVGTGSLGAAQNAQGQTYQAAPVQGLGVDTSNGNRLCVLGSGATCQQLTYDAAVKADLDSLLGGTQIATYTASKAAFVSLAAAAYFGKLFASGFVTVTAVASKYSTFQIFNPSNATTNVLVQGLRCYLGTAGPVQISFYNTARTTQVGSGISLIDGNAASVAQVYKDNISANSAVAMETAQTAATPATSLLLSTGMFILPPGDGIEVEAQTVNITMYCEAFWMEM